MIEKKKTQDGKDYWTMPHQDLKAVSAWVRCFLHAALGPELGEARYKKFRLVDALELWSAHTSTEN